MRGRAPVVCRRWGATAPAACAVHAEDLSDTAAMALLQRRIATSSDIVLPSAKFDELATSCGVADVASSRRRLAAAGVILLGDGVVLLRPMAFALASLKAGGGAVDALPAIAQAQRNELERLRTELAEMQPKLDKALARVAGWRKMVWGGALTFSGAQLAVISRLTYFDLDWDIMEPISYFITTGTALAFYTYFMFHRKEHSYVGFDENYVPKRLRKACKAEGLDLDRYIAVSQKAALMATEIQAAEAWSQRH
jgi:calcium uniporter protein, mitochondrial